MSLAPSPARPTAAPIAVRAVPSAAAPSRAPGPAPGPAPAARPAAAPTATGAADRSPARTPVPSAAPREPWQASAACAGLPPDVVFTKRAKIAAPALRACTSCPVRRECEQAVAPAESWFDGVCGGRLWRNGRPAALTSPSGSPRD